MIAYLRGEPGGEVVRGLLEDPAAVCYAHAINLIEVFYDFLRASDERTARAALRTLKRDGVIARRDLGEAFSREVGQLKVNPGRIALADCFCRALARAIGGELVTSDHREFDPLVPLKLCPIVFIR